MREAAVLGSANFDHLGFFRSQGIDGAEASIPVHQDKKGRRDNQETNGLVFVGTWTLWRVYTRRCFVWHHVLVRRSSYTARPTPALLQQTQNYRLCEPISVLHIYDALCHGSSNLYMDEASLESV